MRNTIQTKYILTSLLLKLLIVKPEIIDGKSISRFKVMKMIYECQRYYLMSNNAILKL